MFLVKDTFWFSSDFAYTVLS